MKVGLHLVVSADVLLSDDLMFAWSFILARSGLMCYWRFTYDYNRISILLKGNIWRALWLAGKPVELSFCEFLLWWFQQNYFGLIRSNLLWNPSKNLWNDSIDGNNQLGLNRYLIFITSMMIFQHLTVATTRPSILVLWSLKHHRFFFVPSRERGNCFSLVDGAIAHPS